MKRNEIERRTRFWGPFILESKDPWLVGFALGLSNVPLEDAKVTSQTLPFPVDLGIMTDGWHAGQYMRAMLLMNGAMSRNTA
jgi:hypothetical protein